MKSGGERGFADEAWSIYSIDKNITFSKNDKLFAIITELFRLLNPRSGREEKQFRSSGLLGSLRVFQQRCWVVRVGSRRRLQQQGGLWWRRQRNYCYWHQFSNLKITSYMYLSQRCREQKILFGHEPGCCRPECKYTFRRQGECHFPGTNSGWL